MSFDIHPTADRLLSRAEKERLHGHRSFVIWLYGLSGSGKTTLANALERRLHGEHRHTCLLDGDNLRSGLTSDLRFSEEDRRENIRRAAEVARLFVQNGTVVICAFITPREEFRQLARTIVGTDDFLEVFVECSFAACASRDPKGLYARAASGDLQNFTGHDSGFEHPVSPDLRLNTESQTPEQAIETLYQHIAPRLELTET